MNTEHDISDLAAKVLSILEEADPYVFLVLSDRSFMENRLRVTRERTLITHIPYYKIDWKTVPSIGSKYLDLQKHFNTQTPIQLYFSRVARLCYKRCNLIFGSWAPPNTDDFSLIDYYNCMFTRENVEKLSSKIDGRVVWFLEENLLDVDDNTYDIIATL